MGCSAVLLCTIKHTTRRHSPNVCNFMSTDMITSYSRVNKLFVYVFKTYTSLGMLDDPAFVSVRGKRGGCFSEYPGRVWGPHSFLFSWCRGAVPAVKWLGHEVDHAIPSSARVKKVWSFASALHICFHFMYTGTTLPVLVLLYSGGLLKEIKFLPESTA